MYMHAGSAAVHLYGLTHKLRRTVPVPSVDIRTEALVRGVHFAQTCQNLFGAGVEVVGDKILPSAHHRLRIAAFEKNYRDCQRSFNCGSPCTVSGFMLFFGGLVEGDQAGLHTL